MNLCARLGVTTKIRLGAGTGRLQRWTSLAPNRSAGGTFLSERKRRLARKGSARHAKNRKRREVEGREWQRKWKENGEETQTRKRIDAPRVLGFERVGEGLLFLFRSESPESPRCLLLVLPLCFSLEPVSFAPSPLRVLFSVSPVWQDLSCGSSRRAPRSRFVPCSLFPLPSSCFASPWLVLLPQPRCPRPQGASAAQKTLVDTP